MNIQSLNTSIALLNSVVDKHSVDLVLLQEIWSPKPGFSLHNFQDPIFKQRHDNYGGVGILAHRKLKVVHRPEFNVSGLEALWLETCLPGSNKRFLFGTVYIHGGKVDQIRLFDEALSSISKSHDCVVIGMDANSRNALWDNSSLPTNGKSKQMGHLLTDVIAKHNLYVHNSGENTYHSGEVSSAIDVTLSRGLIDKAPVSWKVLDDDLSSPHHGLLLSIGTKPVFDPVEVIDWDKFDWGAYGLRSRNCCLLL